MLTVFGTSSTNGVYLKKSRIISVKLVRGFRSELNTRNSTKKLYLQLIFVRNYKQV